jgi:hypothetical protein
VNLATIIGSAILSKRRGIPPGKGTIDRSRSITPTITPVLVAWVGLPTPPETSAKCHSRKFGSLPAATFRRSVTLLSFSGWRCGSELTPADPLYLFCTCTGTFCRFWQIEPFEFSKSFENFKIVADRLLPPSYPLFSDLHSDAALCPWAFQEYTRQRSLR